MISWFSHFAEEYKRARHTFGFGVHSPFAYDMVRLLRIRRDVGFYADAEISEVALAESGKRLRRTAIRFHRLCSFMSQGKVYVASPAPKAILLGVRLASSRFDIVRDVSKAGECVVGYFDANETGVDELSGILSSGCPVAMVSGLSEIEARETACRAGSTLLLSGRDVSVMVRRPEMHPVVYTVRL